MSQIPSHAIEIDNVPPLGFKYSICTLMSRPDEYAEMVESFIRAGFITDFCEYLYIDNSTSNKYDAYKGLNKFLTHAKGEYVILCHQDILLNYDNIDVLEKRIQEIEQVDTNWAIIANAGAVGLKNVVYRITGQDGILETRGVTPQKVSSVDENFMLLKRDANIAFSINLNGFHLYGTDICLQAASRGYTAYVVDFNLLHKSKGNADERFYKLKDDFIKKYLSVWKGRYIETTITKFYLSGSPLLNLFFSSGLMMFLSRKYYKRKYKNKANIIN